MSRLQEIAEEVKQLSEEEYAMAREDLVEDVVNDMDLAHEFQIEAMRLLVLTLVKQLPAEQRDGLKLLVDVLQNDIAATQTFACLQLDSMRKHGADATRAKSE